MSSKVENVKLAIQAIDHKISKLSHRRNELEVLLTKLSSKTKSISSVQRTPSVSEPQATLNRGATVTGAKTSQPGLMPKPPVASGGTETGLRPEEEAVVAYYLQRINLGELNYDKASEFMPQAYRRNLEAAKLDSSSMIRFWNIALKRSGRG